MKEVFMKILITGSRGYIGYNLIQYLKTHAPDIELIGLDSTFKELTKNFKTKLSNNHPADIQQINESILEAKLPLDVTHVVHLAGRTGVRASWDAEQLKSYYEANVLSTHRIFKTYSRPPYKKDIPILYATSSSVSELKSPYAMTKAMVEMVAPLTAIGMRFFTVYGGEYPRSDMLYGKALLREIDELTENKRDFTHIDYVCEAIHALLLYGKPDRIYDIGYGNPKTPKEFLEELDILPTTILNSIPMIEKSDESQCTQADPTEIEKILSTKRLRELNEKINQEQEEAYQGEN
jgi:nucleoside-diphosphate-sugar epimerase